MSSFDTARDIRLPGVVIEKVFIDPKQLTTRMKNAVKKMLREGHAHGGWNSKSKHLTQKIAEAHGLMVVSSSGYGFYAPPRSSYGKEQIDAILPLIDADEALELMEDAQDYAANPGHLERIQDRTRTKHQRNRDVLLGKPAYRWIAPGATRDIMQQMIEIFTETRSAEMREKAEKVCDMIDNGTPIPINLSY